MGGNVWEWTATERNGGYITRGASWWYGPERQQESDVESKSGDIAVGLHWISVCCRRRETIRNVYFRCSVTRD
jgi:formylglycine-generating enzyme required for sulfatase activity